MCVRAFAYSLSFFFFFAVLLSCFFIIFFFNDTATTEIYTLSLHDALPISLFDVNIAVIGTAESNNPEVEQIARQTRRSEEHTSELQSPDHLVCRLLLEKKNIEVADYDNTSHHDMNVLDTPN